MNVKEVSLPEAADICEREESHFFDRKGIGISGKKVEKIAVAFANADGGDFVIGIMDDKEEPVAERRWDGADRIEDLNSHLQVLFGLSPNIDLRYEVLRSPEKKGYVLRVMIEKGSDVHKTSDGTVYQRYGAQSLPIKDPQRIMELSFAKGAKSFEDQVLKDVRTEQIVESAELLSFLSCYSPRSDPLEFCVNQNLVDFSTWETKVAGVLLFHQNPGAAMPRKCSVKIVRYETKIDDPERDHLVSQETIEGPLHPLIHKTIEKATSILSSISMLTSEGLKKVNYPPEAVWEVTVNALIHRDYSISDDVQIVLYNNRIEIISPGRLPGYVTTKNILEARYARNPKIVRTLNRYPNPPNKDMGEGLNTTFQRMKEWGLQSPVIVEENNYVKVVLQHTPLASPSEAILRYLKTNESITNQITRDITGIKSENQVKNEFYRLRDEGFIERVPNLRGAKAAWRLTEKGHVEVRKLQ